MARHGVFSDSKKPTVGPYLLLSPVRTVVKPAFSRSRCVYDCGSAGERCRKRQVRQGVLMTHDHVKTFLTHAHCAQTCCNFWLSPWATCARYFLCVSRGRFARCGVCWHLLPSLTREWTLFVSDTHCEKKKKRVRFLKHLIRDCWCTSHKSSQQMRRGFTSVFRAWELDAVSSFDFRN